MVIFDGCPTRLPGLPRAGGSSGGGRGWAASPQEHQAFPLWPGLLPVTCPPAPRAGLASEVEAAPGQAHWVTIIHTNPKSTGQREGWGSAPPAPPPDLVNSRLGGDKDESGPSRPCRLPRHLTKLKALWSPLPGGGL